jgi:uncharacterized membrane protein YdjX (TVP38/TMEM64 family)
MIEHKLRRITGIAGILLLVTFIVLVSALFVYRFGDIVKNPQVLRDTVVQYGIWGYVIFSLFNIFQIIFAPIPGHVVTISSGILFGVVKGILVTWTSVIIGGSVVMVISRYFGRKMVELLFIDKAKTLETTITKKGIPFILLLSVLPNPLGDGLFYLAGITTIPLRVLIPVIALGRLPGIILSVLVGDRIMSAGVKGWIIGGVGLCVALLVYKFAGKRLELWFETMIRKLGKPTGS